MVTERIDIPRRTHATQDVINTDQLINDAVLCCTIRFIHMQRILFVKCILTYIIMANVSYVLLLYCIITTLQDCEQ